MIKFLEAKLNNKQLTELDMSSLIKRRLSLLPVHEGREESIDLFSIEPEDRQEAMGGTPQRENPCRIKEESESENNQLASWSCGCSHC